MKNLKLLFDGIILFVLGLKLELLKHFAEKRLFKRILKNKPVSDRISILLNKKIHTYAEKWIFRESKYHSEFASAR